MIQTATITQSDYHKLLNRIAKLENIVADFIRAQKEPPYGSDEWFAWAHKQGLEAKKRGDYTRLETQEDLENFFNKL